MRAWRTQFPRPVAPIPKSRATWATGLPPSKTNATASALNSFVKRRLALPGGPSVSINDMVTSQVEVTGQRGDAHPDRIHDTSGLIRHASTAGLSGEQARRLREAMGSVTGEQASAWRETGAYPFDIKIPGNPADATPSFSTDMVAAAVGIAQECAHLVDIVLGTETDSSSCVKRRAADASARIPLIDPS